MKANMGKVDRVIRAIVAVIIAALYFTNIITGVFGLVLLIAAAIFALTSMVSVCPVYMPFGLSSCKSKEAANE